MHDWRADLCHGVGLGRKPPAQIAGCVLAVSAQLPGARAFEVTVGQLQQAKTQANPGQCNRLFLAGVSAIQCTPAILGG
jgi:hypothetical protein